jgi:hypothetical protein
MVRRCRSIVLLVAAALCAPAGADVVYLKNGNRVEGEVSPGTKPGSIKVALDKGLEIEFAKEDIREVEKKKSPAKEFDEKLAALPPDDVDALLELADWARERKLRSKEETVYKKVLEIDPDDPVARREMGFVVFKNRWVKESELKSKHGLVQFRGDWVTPEEKERRIGEELKKEVADLLRDVDSGNQYIRDYSVGKLLEYREPRVKGIILEFLGDPREKVRAVCLQVLTALEESSRAKGKSRTGTGGKTAGKATGKGAKAAAPAPGPGEEEVAQVLLERTLKEDSPSVRATLAGAIGKIGSRKFFDLALAVLESSEKPTERDRAAEGIFAGLRKSWVPDLIAALARRPKWAGPTEEGNPQVRAILARLSGQNFGYRTADWKAWWSRAQGRFYDEQ